MKRKLISLLILSVLSLTAYASADTSIRAEVDKTSITTDETLAYKLTITTNDKNLTEPQIPGFNGFDVVYSAQSSTVSVAKNDIKTSVVYSFILAPNNVGKFMIEPSQIKVRGKTYSSEVFEIEVKQGAASPQPPQKERPPQPEENLPESKEPQITL
jgi:hypothetical protein